MYINIGSITSFSHCPYFKNFKAVINLILLSMCLSVFQDNVKKALVKQGYTEYLLKVVSSLKDEKNDELAKQRVQSSADIIVMLLTEGGLSFLSKTLL